MTQQQTPANQDDAELNSAQNDVQILLLTAYNEDRKLWEDQLRAASDNLSRKLAELKVLNENSQSKSFFIKLFTNPIRQDRRKLELADEVEKLKNQVIAMTNNAPNPDSYELAIWGNSIFKGFK